MEGKEGRREGVRGGGREGGKKEEFLAKFFYSSTPYFHTPLCPSLQCFLHLEPPLPLQEHVWPPHPSAHGKQGNEGQNGTEHASHGSCL